MNEMNDAQESQALKKVLDALRAGRVALEWAGRQEDANRCADAMDDARSLERRSRVTLERTDER